MRGTIPFCKNLFSPLVESRLTFLFPRLLSVGSDVLIVRLRTVLSPTDGTVESGTEMPQPESLTRKPKVARLGRQRQAYRVDTLTLRIVELSLNVLSGYEPLTSRTVSTI